MDLPKHVRVIDDTFCFEGLENGDVVEVLRFCSNLGDVLVVDKQGMVQCLMYWEFEGVVE